MIKRLCMFSVLAILFFSVAFSVLGEQKTLALSGSDFRSGRIIDDAIFFNKDSMSAAQIQQFLNAKLPTCDRYHTSSNPSYQPPYTCLNEYLENTSTKENNYGRFDGNGNPVQVVGGKSAAQIIWDAGQQYGINPQVLIIMLQKEQSLVTDNWPWKVQYDKAMGYACPDTAACDTTYFGFYNQVNSAAGQLRRYVTYPDSYNFKAGVTRAIRYSPNASCGSGNVILETAGTAALYNYTPYQPNQAALNNLYGTGDGCSAYGNRNFWRMFNDWFGSTHFSSITGCSQATNTTIACVWTLRNYISNVEVYVTSYSELVGLLSGGGHAYVGLGYFGNVAGAPQPGNIPIYKLTKPNGSSFLTASNLERSSLVAHGYIDNGILFYADPTWSNSGYPVYRLYSAAADRHIWVASPGERDQYVAWGFTDEGVAFRSISSVRQERASPEGRQLVYRFSGMPNNSHFWTTYLDERDRMITSGYRYEGVAWNSSASITNKPVFRLYSPTMRKHLYTLDESEKNVLSGSGHWNYEGINQYMSDTVTDKPVYRLYSPVTTNHLWTTDSNERDVLVRSGTFRFEGIAWYQP